MTSYEELARRYCALLGEKPDEQIDGVEIWRLALADLEAAMNALDTYGLDVRRTFHKLADSAEPGSESAPAPNSRKVA